MSEKQELVERTKQKNENKNELGDQTQSGLTKEHLCHHMFLMHLREKIVKDGPTVMAATVEKLNYMESILRDRRKLVKKQHFISFKNPVKITEETGNRKQNEHLSENGKKNLKRRRHWHVTV